MKLSSPLDTVADFETQLLRMHTREAVASGKLRGMTLLLAECQQR